MASDKDHTQPPCCHKDQLSEYPVLEVDDMAPSCLKVDVEINDHGVEYEMLLFAGHTSLEVVSSNTFAPQLTWALASKQEQHMTTNE
ncbi:Aste57867_17059 [Aphanomyces stellatus]|uniref:Aste57867_17059 protein n=1 Tax=Aphanomyces stellatus TaxID=120398 RepID=A0A485LAB1_9STRA|nr:hypothetical protein As57867_017001 [Aphanomyces stellatus]VFT93820.1 Aste57867_17059 [Aphanomyces stellatus]